MKAFTAVELLLSVFLLGVLAVAAVSLIPPLSGYRLDAAANQVRSDIQYVQQYAMTTGHVSGIQFVNSGSYTAYQDTVATPIMSPLTRTDMIVTLSTYYPGVSVSNNYTVEFDAFGKPTTGGGGSVSITHGSSSKTISVTANTGKVNIQ